jgi:cell division protein FtsN
VHAEPSRVAPPSEDVGAPPPRRETIVPADREIAAPPDERAEQPGPAGEERESPHGGVWADSPMRDQADERPAARPDEDEPDRDARPATHTSRQRATAARASKELVEDSRDDPRRAKVDRKEARRRGRTSAAEERREALAEARAEAADSRHRKSSHDARDERRRGVTLVRASVPATRPSRATSRMLDDEPTKKNPRARTGRRSPAGDEDDDAGHGAGRAARKAQGKNSEKDSEKYTVQLGPYRTRKAVDTARADLSRRGYEARVVGQTLQLGNFSQRSRADRLASQLRVNGHPATSAAVR